MKRAWIWLLFPLSAWALDWQGHRGARGLYPENTIGAMMEAMKYPAVTTLELDVVVSKDGQVVVSHEPWMADEICLDPQGKPVSGKSVNLYRLDHAAIAQYDCGSKPHPRFPLQKKIKEHKPTLKALLAETEAAMKRTGKSLGYNIEIKSTVEDERDGFQPQVTEFTDKVLAVIRAQLPLTRVHIQSFDWRVLRYLHQKYPAVQTVALIEESYEPQAALKALGFHPTVFSPYFKNLTAQHVKHFQGLGIKVIPWTVNEVAEMRQVRALGVDGIITDYPDRIAQASSAP